MKTCPGCHRLYFKAAGVIRVIAEDGEVELSICKRCFKFLEEKGDNLVYAAPKK